MRFLVVEDDAPVARLMASLLPGDVEVRGTLQDALKALAATRYDVVIYDLGLPDTKRDVIRGLETLVAFTRLQRAKVLVVSGNEERGILQRSRAAGADDFLRKPVDVDALLTRVDIVTEQSRMVDICMAIERGAHRVEHGLGLGTRLAVAGGG